MAVQREMPKTLRWLGDIDAFHRVTEVSLFGKKTSEEAIPLLMRMTELRSITFGPTASISPDAIAALQASKPRCKVTMF